MLWEHVVNGAKVLGYCVTTLAACVGGYVSFGGPIPATQDYVLAQAQKTAGETRELKTRVIELQMQQNTGRRDTFRKEEFDCQQELQREPSNFAVKQRLDQVRDELELIKRDREKLEKERGN